VSATGENWAGENYHLGEGIGEGAGGSAEAQLPLRDIDWSRVKVNRDYLMVPGDQDGITPPWPPATPGNIYSAAEEFLRKCGMEPSPDAIGQLAEVFLPCLRIMCDPDHPWDPNGATWRRGGIFAVLTDARKKWERFWERTWKHGKRHDDSGFDLINFVGFVMRADPESRWAEWGEPG
jgi:hypothetical protein